MNKTSWIIFTVACVALLGGLIFMSRGNSTDVSDIDETNIVKGSDDNSVIGDHVYGNKDAKVTLIEYGDFECPACSSAYRTVKNVKEKYKNDIKVIFRQFPLAQLHPNARAAAAVSEAAGKQGKFWEMHDILYERQNVWKNYSGENRTKAFEDYAKELNLDIETFSNDIKSKSVKDKLNRDVALAKKAGATGTPTILLNNQKLDQPVKDGAIVEQSTEGATFVWQDADALSKLFIEPAIEKAKADK